MRNKEKDSRKEQVNKPCFYRYKERLAVLLSQPVKLSFMMSMTSTLPFLCIFLHVVAWPLSGDTRADEA